MTTLFICPFCSEAVASTAGFLFDADDVERDLRIHVRSRHPFRWRLSRKFRRAMKVAAA